MARLLKCYGTCGDKYEKEKLVKDGGKNYCDKCYKQKHIDKRERNNLYETIRALYNITHPTGMMLKQIKQFRYDYDYSYEDMRYTLMYCKNHKPNIKFQHKYGVSIIPYIIEEAKDNRLKEAEQMKNGGFEVNRDKSVVNVKAKGISKKKVTREINMEDLF